MTYTQFWDEDPELAVFYIKAHDLKRQERNQEMWMQGLYVYKAIECFVPVLVSSPRKGAKVERYLDHLIPINGEQADKQERNIRKEKAMAYMQDRMSKVNQRFLQGKSGE